MAKLQSILSTKEGQEQLKNLQNMFGGMASQQTPSQENPQPQQKQNEAPPQNSGFDFSSIASMLSSMNGGGDTASNQEQPSSGGMPNIDMNMLLTMQQIFQGMNTNDKNSQLLLALKPHFSEQRSKKVDQAIGLMRIFSMLPMLKESGILKALTGF